MGWMLYGANGYTGALIAEAARRRGLRPILAGRTAGRIEPIAERLGLEHRVFPLDDSDAVARHLDGVELVLLTAGPFSATSRVVVDACLRTGSSYLDITGEIGVFEAVLPRGDEARRAGSVLIPGVGFDVVPTDCLAASLAAAMPDAVGLELAFAAVAGVSAGTAKTMIENLHRGSAVRRDGAIERIPSASLSKTIRFRDKERPAVAIPWGDVSTAFHSTGIPNITVYMAMPPSQARAMRWMRPFMSIAGLPAVQRLLTSYVERKITGPTEEERRTRRSHVWGRVVSRDGRSVEGTLETPEGYELTVRTAVEIASRVLDGAVEPGAYTPSRAFGAGFIAEIEGCDLRVG